MKKRLLLTVLSALPLLVFAEEFSLKQCIDFADQNNRNITNARKDVEIAREKVQEQVGTALPQIDASTNYTNNLVLATTLLPGELAGKPGEKMAVQMGVKHNLSGSLQLTQKVFDPTFKIALRASKISRDQAEVSLTQTRETNIYNISTVYYQTLVIGKQLNALKSNLSSSASLLASTELKYKNGMAKEVDVDKIRVSYNNLHSQVQQSKLNLNYSMNDLKFLIGMPEESTLILTDTNMVSNTENVEQILQNFDMENRSDLKLLNITLEAYRADRDRNIAGYWPTLNLNANVGFSAMGKEFDYFSSSQKWYPNSSVGFSLKFSVFDGLQRHRRVTQSKLNIEKSLTNIEQGKKSILLDLNNYENQYKTAVNNINNEKANMELAEKVFKNTQLQFTQGMSTSLEIVQAENSYIESSNNYFSKLLNLYVARLNLEKSKGTLLNFVNK